MVLVDEFIIASSNYVPGYEITETKGFVYGLTVRSRGVGGQIGAGIRSMFGGDKRVCEHDGRNQRRSIAKNDRPRQRIWC